MARAQSRIATRAASWRFATRGWTLVELLTAVAVGAVVAAWGVPTFGEFTRNAARTREVNQFL